MQKCFIFDLNKCVGCHACVLACHIENKHHHQLKWREIDTYNECKHPDLLLFHYSLACNHCEEALCMLNCPAQAYSRDYNTGAVIHHSEKCIGCKYCTWACPYDAPKYNDDSGLIEKCTFCNDRILNGEKPSCANLCPTGALDFGDKTEKFLYQKDPGFVDIGIKPSIQIIPLRKKNTKPSMAVIPVEKDELPLFPPEPVISLKKEWPLMIFTLIASVLVSLITANSFAPFQLNQYIFLSGGIISVILTFFHLGKKMRFYRIIMNVRNSWLSRELFFYSAFLLLSTIHLFFFPDNLLIATIASFVGFATLISIDMIYHVTIKPAKFDLHSAHILLTGLFLTGLFMKNFIIFSLVGLIKIGLYIYRKYYFHKIKRDIRIMVSAWRIAFMVSFPLIIWWFNPPNVFWYVALFIFLGEMIDRYEYYTEIDIITPKKQIYAEMMKRLYRK
jgi:Fe-S-cluster-containing dehydrogenase component/DMSO reductase anchor subunit